MVQQKATPSTAGIGLRSRSVSRPGVKHTLSGKVMATPGRWLRLLSHATVHPFSRGRSRTQFVIAS